MKLSQIIIVEETELDYSGIDTSTVNQLKKYKPHYQQWAIEQLRSGVDIRNILDSINYYDSKIGDNRFQEIIKKFSPHPKNILTLSSQQIHDALTEFEQKYPSISKRETKRRLLKGGLVDSPHVTVLVDDSHLKIIRILDGTNEAATYAAELAKGTKWCVVNRETAKEYLELGPLYFIFIKGEKKYLCHIESTQFRDVDDDKVKIGLELFDAIYPYIPGVGVFYFPKHSAEYRDAVKIIPEKAVDYAVENIKGRFEEAEPFIAKDPSSAYTYATKILHDRFPLAEPTFLKYPGYALRYARDVLKSRWAEAEPEIATVPQFALDYAFDVIGGRFPEAEPYIIQDPQEAYRYSRMIIKGRWPEAEATISKDPSSAYSYAKNILRKSWPEAESTIMKSDYALAYENQFLR